MSHLSMLNTPVRDADVGDIYVSDMEISQCHKVCQSGTLVIHFDYVTSIPARYDAKTTDSKIPQLYVAKQVIKLITTLTVTPKTDVDFSAVSPRTVDLYPPLA